MIEAVFFENNSFYYSFLIKGHADYNINGEDIVCAAVSSAVDMTIDAIKNIVCEKNNLEIDNLKASVSFSLFNKNNKIASMFIKSLCNHLVNISRAYPNNIKIKIK